MTKHPETQPNPRLLEEANALSQRDQALLKLERLMAENPEPEDAVEDGGALIDVSELADTRAKPLRPARRPSRSTARPKRPGGQGPGLLGHILQALIVILVVVWVFLLGVLVGRSRPEEKGLAAWLEKAIGWAQPRPAALSPAAVVQPPPYPARTPAAPAPPPPDFPGRAEPKFDEPEEWTAVPESAPSDLAAPADGEALASADPGSLFAVQVTLAGDEAEARQRVAQLEAQGFTAYFYHNGRRFFVRVGPFPTRTEAANNRRRLEELGYKAPYVSKLR